MHPGLAGARCGAALSDGEPGEFTVGIDVEVGAQGVQTGGLEPLPTPVRQVAAGRAFQSAEQVIEGGVVECVRGEVVPQSGQEVFQTDVGHELLEDAGTFGVGDAVEVHLNGVQIRNVSGDRMGRRQLVLAVGPRLLHIGECRPRLAVFGRVGLAEYRGEGGEGLVEPQVIPPPHGHQVAEPHVRHLVQHRLGAALVGGPGDLAAEHIVLQEGHRSGVLHRPGVELGDEQLVVLAEGVGHCEVGVVEVEALLGLGEQPLMVHEGSQRGPAEQAERNFAVFVGVDVVPARVGPGDQRHQVGAQSRCRRERVDARLAVFGDTEQRTVGDHLPVRGRGHGDVECGLDVGLVETGEHPLGVGGFELRVQVDMSVYRIDEAVQALSGV